MRVETEPISILSHLQLMNPCAEELSYFPEIILQT